MPNKGIAGQILEVRRSGGELLHLDWRIPRFLDLPCGDWDYYESPRFQFYDARWLGLHDFYESPSFGFHDFQWHLRVYPNKAGEVHLSLSRDYDGGPSARRVIYSLGMRGSGGGVEKRTQEKEREVGYSDGYRVVICSRSELSEQEDGLMEGGTITFVCQMKVPGTAATGASSSSAVPIRTNTQTREPNARTYKFQALDKKGASSSSAVPIRTNTQTRKPNAPTCKCQSLDKQDASTQTEAEVKEARVDDKQSSEKRGMERKVLEDMGKFLDSGNKSDVTVQVQETEFRVHSSILFARSPVLSAMLEHDTAERASHRINIDHCQPDVFEEYLRYLYTGSVRSLSRQTVFGLYRVADQYLADDLKRLCLEHIRDTLCVQTFCDAVTLAVTHGESDLLRLAVDFAAENIQPILRSVEWQNFICEHPREANEILIKSVRPQS